MKVFPLIRTKLSNEYIMALLFSVLVLYQVPHWLQHPSRIFVFIGVLFIGLLFDVILNFKRIHMIKCSVSASITVGIIFVLYPDIPFYTGLLATLCGLFFGKHIFNSTGSNILNPAIVGVLVLSMIFPGSSYVFQDHNLTIFALILSIPFVFIRPYPSVGLAIGIILSMYFKGILDLQSFVSSGSILWCCLIITDPVTISNRPLMAAFSGFLGFIALQYSDAGNILSMTLLILFLNLVSFFLESRFPLYSRQKTTRSNIRTPYRKINNPSNRVEPGSFNTPKSDITLSKETILDRIKINEVRGLGGSGFPTHKKIESFIKSSSTDKYIIVNGVECDPGLIHDKWILTEYSHEIEKGIQAIQECTFVDNIFLATKSSPDIDFKSNVKIINVPDYYPIGGEKILIRTLLDKTFETTEIPAEEGILVLNVQTILSIYEAVFCNEKVNSKYITIANMENKNASIVNVTLGNKISDYIKDPHDDEISIFAGGGLMQSKLASENDLIDHSTNFIALSEHPRYKDSYCSKCGICENRCPSGLKVWKIVDLINNNQIDEAKKHHPENCISCGICSYYCLAGINLSSIINSVK